MAQLKKETKLQQAAKVVEKEHLVIKVKVQEEKKLKNKEEEK